MRLLVCVPWFAPARAFGGTVTAAVATVKGALAAGHDVTVATTDVLDLRSRVPADAPAEPAGARVVRFPNVSQPLATANAPLPRGLRTWLREHVREFDVVLLLDVYSSVSVRAARAAARAGVPYVLEALGTLPATRERGRALPKRVFLGLWGRRTVRKAAACLYLSDAERKEYLAQGANPARLHPMPPPLDLPDPGEVPRAPAPTVVYLGQLHPIKRIDVLIDAFAQVRAALREARLEVIGAPSSHGDALRERAARLGLGGSVAFRGLIPEEQKGRALARLRPAAGGRRCGDRLRRDRGGRRRGAAGAPAGPRTGTGARRGRPRAGGSLPARDGRARAAGVARACGDLVEQGRVAGGDPIRIEVRERLGQLDRERHVTARARRRDHDRDIRREHPSDRLLPAHRRFDRRVDAARRGQSAPRARVDHADELEPCAAEQLRSGKRRNQRLGSVVAVECTGEDQLRRIPGARRD